MPNQEDLTSAHCFKSDTLRDKVFIVNFLELIWNTHSAMFHSSVCVYTLCETVHCTVYSTVL